MLVGQLGGSAGVAELTGRKTRLVRDPTTGRVTAERRNAGMGVSMEKINLTERSLFMAGEKRVAIISEAASSGISLQADKRVANTQVRVHLTLELPWSADQCIQQCGRTHRSNQVHGPEYILCMTACGGERRFASTVAQRLQSMGALTKGDRRAADASDLSAFDVDTNWGRRAMNSVLDVLCNAQFSRQHPPPPHIRRALGMHANGELQRRWGEYLDGAEDALACAGIDPEKVDVKGFLNRLLGMSVEMQNLIFSHFAAQLDEEIRIAKENDKFDEGVVDVRGEAIKLSGGYPETIATEKSTGVKLEAYRLDVDRGISYDKAIELLNDKGASNDGGQLMRGEGFYRSRRPMTGREKDDVRGYTLLLQKKVSAFALNAVPIYKVYRPATGLGAPCDLQEFTSGGRYQRVDPVMAQKGWKRLYADGLHMCCHGPNCKDKAVCLMGRREQPVFIVTGAVLPFWTFIQQTVGYKVISTANAEKRVSRMSIVRVRFTDTAAPSGASSGSRSTRRRRCAASRR